MDYPILVDTLSLELSILYFKGVPVKVSIKWYISFHVMKIVFRKTLIRLFGQQWRPWRTAAQGGISDPTEAQGDISVCQNTCLHVSRMKRVN